MGQLAARTQARRVSAAVVDVRNLGTLGGAVSQAKAVNRQGHVVGTSQDALGRTRAFVWRDGAGMVDLSPPGGVHTSANDINDLGAIAGGGDTGFGEFHAYLLSDETSFDLGTLGGGESEALALNRLAHIVGRGRISGGGARHAWLVSEPGRMVDLGTLGGASSVAHDVSDWGEVVGLAETNAGQAHAFLWTATQGMRDLGAPGGVASMALAVNNRAEIVGGSGHACLWRALDGSVDLGTLGGRTSCAYDINDLGYIVGVSQTGATDTRGQPVSHAFLRAPQGEGDGEGGTMLDLGTLGGAHSAAAAVSEESGGMLWVAGHSHDADGRVRAVLWSVCLQ